MYRIRLGCADEQLFPSWEGLGVGKQITRDA